MKKTLIFILPLLLFSCIHQFNQEVKAPKYNVSEEFVQGSEDIPTLVEMERIFESGIGFDTDSGSIIYSSYSISIDLEIAKQFYIETLPQMGWTLERTNIEKIILKRENESLEIEFVNQNGEDVVKFFNSSSI